MADPKREAMLHELEGRGRDAATALAVLSDHIRRRRAALDLEEMNLVRSADGLSGEKALSFAHRRLALHELEQQLRHDVMIGESASTRVVRQPSRERQPLPE